MKPHTRKLYQIIRTKLDLAEQDGLKFIQGIQDEKTHASFDCVIQAIDQMERELIRWMFILWVGQSVITFMIISILVKN
ncbi:MAG: hypothetical protein RLZ91_550 [Bacteroidota bacterium]